VYAVFCDVVRRVSSEYMDTASCMCPIPNEVQQMSEEDHCRMYRAMSELEPLATLVKQLEAKQQVGRH